MSVQPNGHFAIQQDGNYPVLKTIYSKVKITTLRNFVLDFLTSFCSEPLRTLFIIKVKTQTLQESKGSAKINKISYILFLNTVCGNRKQPSLTFGTRQHLNFFEIIIFSQKFIEFGTTFSQDFLYVCLSLTKSTLSRV